MSTHPNKNTNPFDDSDDPFKVVDEIERWERNDTSNGFEEFQQEIPCYGRQKTNLLEEDLDDWLDSQV